MADKTYTDADMAADLKYMAIPPMAGLYDPLRREEYTIDGTHVVVEVENARLGQYAYTSTIVSDEGTHTAQVGSRTKYSDRDLKQFAQHAHDVYKRMLAKEQTIATPAQVIKPQTEDDTNNNTRIVGVARNDAPATGEYINGVWVEWGS